MDILAIKEQIADAVAWYSIDGCKSQDIETILEKQGEIVGLSYTLAEAVAVDQRCYIVAYNQRKLAEAKKYVELKSERKLSVADADRLAIVYGAGDRLSETKAEIDYYSNRTVLLQLNKVLDAIAQRISWLKKEKEYTYLSN